MASRRLPVDARATRVGIKLLGEHFYSGRLEARDVFGGRRHWLLDSLYRRLRHKHDVLMDGPGQPLGERWSFDPANEKT